VPQHEAAWDAFVFRPDVQEAIDVANRKLRAAQRDYARQKRERDTDFHAYLASPEFAATLDGYVEQTMEATSGLAKFLQKEYRDCEPHDLQVLQRLMRVCTVRSLCLFDDKKREELRAFVTAQSPPPPLRAVLRQAYLVRMQHDAIKLLEHGVKLETVFQGQLRVAFNTLNMVLKKCRETGRPVHEVGTGYLSLFGVNYTVDSVPD
jgi:hypothetical protein